MRIVKNGDVHVSAPIGLPRREIDLFIEQHLDWIDKARKKTSEKQKRRADFYPDLQPAGYAGPPEKISGGDEKV